MKLKIYNNCVAFRIHESDRIVLILIKLSQLISLKKVIKLYITEVLKTLKLNRDKQYNANNTNICMHIYYPQNFLFSATLALSKN